MGNRKQKNIDTMANYSSFGMGGVSHPSQHYAVELLEPDRVRRARKAVEQHYNWQRKRYGQAFEEMGLGFTREMVGSTIGWSCQKDWIARVSTNASSNMVLRYYVPLIVTWTGLTPRTLNMRLLTVDSSGSHSAHFFPRVLSRISSSLVEY